MSSALREAIEERLTLRNLAAWVAVVGGLHLLFDAPPGQLALTVVLGTVYGAVDAVKETYDLRESITHVLTGGVGFFGGAAMLALGGETLWLPVAFLLVGAWFLLDAVQTARHEGVTEDDPDGREVYRDYLARRIHDLLDERPRTRRELHAEFEADPADVDAAVETLRERGVVVQSGSEFRVPDDDEGTLDRLTGSLGDVAARVARPLTLEFEDDADETERERDSGRGTAPEQSRGASSAAGSAAEDRDRDREREREREREFAGD